MKYLLLLLLIPSITFADKYEDVQSTLQQVLIAYGQLDTKASQARTVADIAQALGQIAKTVSELKKDAETSALACKKTEEVKK